jgi:GH25 family lysozyme M1 (1,4-beta-N-acetylmuramidase)
VAVDYIWPWPKETRASQEFGTNPGGVNPLGGHTGLDAALAAGTPLRAPADGVVTFEGWANLSNNPYWLTDGGGICLAIDFGDGKPATIMGHLSSTFVSKGDRVKQGQIVAESGNTGKWTTGPHCHLEFLPPVYKMDGDPTYGRRNPRLWCKGYWEDQAPAQLLPYQRETLTKVWQRTAPEHRNDENRVKLWDENLVFDFDGWGHGSDPFGDGNTVWFHGRYSDTWMHSSAFRDQTTHDLPEIAKPVPPTTTFPFLNGLDVSNHNTVDLRKVPGDFVFIKASEGVGWVDPRLGEHVVNARAAGMIPGFYHFARPAASTGNTAEAEAAWFLSCIRPYLQPGDLTSLDWEAENQHLTDWADEFSDRVKAKCGATSFLYAGTGAINAGNWTGPEQKWPLWYPNYGKNEPGGYNPQPAPTHTTWAAGLKIWQYSSRGRIPGYDGDLDLNVFYGTRDDLLKYGATRVISEEPKPEPEPEPKPEPKEFPGLEDPIQKLIDFYHG